MSEEVEENVIILVTSKVVEPNRGARRSSTARPIPSGSPSRSQSTEEVEPRYLRASAGSCHDFCKYGVKHEHEAKKRHAKFPRNLGNHPMPSKEQTKTDALVPQRKKKSGFNMTATPLRDEPNLEHEVVEYQDLPPEKIIGLADSYTNRAEESYEGSPAMKDSCSSDEQHDRAPKNQGEESSEESNTVECATTLNDEGADKHVIVDSSEEMLFKPVSIKDTMTPIKNESYFGDESYSEPASIKFMISSPTQEIVPSPDGSALDHLAEQHEEPITRMVATVSPPESIGSVEHTKDSGVEKSLNKIKFNRPKILPTMGAGSTSKELKNLKSKASAEQRPVNRLVGANKGASGTGSKVSSLGKSTASSLHRPIEQHKDLKLGEKSNELKNAQKETIHAGRLQVTEIARPRTVKKKITSTSKEVIKSVKPEIKLKRSSSATKAAATVTHEVVLKKTISSSKSGASVETSTSMKLKKLSLKSLSSSISLGRITGRKNQEKVIKVAKNLNDGKDKVAEPSSLNSSSTKPRKNMVYTTKLQHSRNISPASTVKNQAKVGRLGAREKSSYTSQPKPENIDLKAVRQKLRKPISHSSFRTGEHETSGIKSREAKKSTRHKEVNERSSNDALRGAIKRSHRRTASTHSLDKIAIPRKISFNRGKVVSIQPENNTPVRLRFRRAKTMIESQNSNVRSTSSGSRTGPWVYSSIPLSKAPTVVLRHQDVNDKKETQGLFNHVIEETASKLVETRKSKVKALVGAFETVISLQESKAATAVSMS